MKKWLLIRLWLVFSLSLVGVQPVLAEMYWVDAAAATDGDIASVIMETYIVGIIMKNGMLVQTWFGRRATIAVTFDTPHYFITATAGSGGSISPSGSIRVEENATQTFTITADDWIDISDALVDGTSVGAVSSYTCSDVAADHAIEAGFANLVPDVWVDDDYSVGGDNDGHTWMADAFNIVQEGIDAVTAPAIVHVAAGVYNDHIGLKSGVQVLGAGADVTTLDGTGLHGMMVTVQDVDDTSVFEGFTVQNGTKTISAVQGTGMSLTNSNSVIRNCVFRENQALSILNNNSSPVLSDCSIISNDGGGMYNSNGSNPVLTGCLFEDNLTYSMQNCDSSPDMTGCDFIGNFIADAVANQGGAMRNENATPRIVNCRFINNKLDNGIGGFAGGGGAIYNLRSSPEIRNCTFTGNAAGSSGAIFNLISSPSITNCAFTNNSDYEDDDDGGAITNLSGSAPAITNCTFTGNSGFKGGAIYTDLSSASALPTTVTNCIFSGNSAERDGGAIYSQFSGSPLHVVNSVFSNNEPDSDADGNGLGGALYNDRADVTISVDFMPTAAGQQNTDLTITSNDPDESPLTVFLTGTGLPLYHTIIASAGSGGSITPSGSVELVDGEDQSFTIAAAAGFTVFTVLVDGVSVGAVTTYGFADVTADHTIEAQFAQPGDIIVGTVSGNTDESGATAEFTIALASKPTDDVEISVASDDATEADVSPVVLIFAPANWNTPQIITVTGVDDDVTDGDISYAILLAAISSDMAYDGMNPPDITLINLDDEDVPPAGTGGDNGNGGGGNGGGGCFIHSFAGIEI